jgi:hypothetical protein
MSVMPALPCWSAHDQGHRRRCAIVLRAARASSSWSTHAEATVPPCRDARSHQRERGREGVAVVADKARMRAQACQGQGTGVGRSGQGTGMDRV